jgi:hypothetical protein
MENISRRFYEVFRKSIEDYHLTDSIDAPFTERCFTDRIDGIFYKKSWIDTVQWHLEDLIRDPDISAPYGLSIKRRIDTLNQQRTDIVEHIDEYFDGLYRDVVPGKNARHNTESLGWAFDRLSILALKEYHLDCELRREDGSMLHLVNVRQRKEILDRQKEDLLRSIDWLNEEIQQGKKINKIYKQLKMYNDHAYNPVLYNKRK